MKLGILGGSFNPPHLGHLYIAQSAYREFSLDSVLLLPLGTPPHKAHIAPKEARKAMCDLLAQAGEGLQVCTLELEREGYTYTVDTLQQLRRLYPEDRFYYLIGTDTLFQLESWRDYERVLTYTEFICVPRPGDDSGAVREKIDWFRRKYGKEILLSREAGPDISSTEVRKAIGEGKSTEGLLLPEIRQYIEENGLYADA